MMPDAAALHHSLLFILRSALRSALTLLIIGTVFLRFPKDGDPA